MYPENTPSRIHLWDNIKGILIFLVVFAHFLYDLQTNPIINATVDSIYMFHMAVFVFVSGYFGKSAHSRSTESLFKLVTAYIIFNGLTGIFLNSYIFLTPLYSFWYILALIIWRLITPIIAFNKLNIILTILLSILVGYISEIDNTFALSRIIGFLPYYLAGYMLSNEYVQTHILTKNIRTSFVGLICLSAAVIIGIFSFRFFHYSDDSLLFYPYKEPQETSGRVFLYTIGTLFIISFVTLVPNKKIPWLTNIGKNSLNIYLLHRIITLKLNQLIQIENTFSIFLVYLALTFILCTILSLSPVNKAINYILETGSLIFCRKTVSGPSSTITKTLLFSVGTLFFLHPPIYRIADIFKTPSSDNLDLVDSDNADIIYPKMTEQNIREFNNAFRILFAGDLILLEDQVKRGYKSGSYQYDDIFAYTRSYIESADLAIGVYEGPSGGESVGYSTSNYNDNKTLALNFPDEFAIAVKNAGFDLVTTANNHVLDKGVAAAHRTLDLLDKIGLDHTGSYRSQTEKESSHIKLLEVQGIRFAFLSYTYGTNNYSNQELINGKLSYITSIIPEIDSPEFEKAKSDVENDFIKAKSLNPDFIVVLPHAGTQFINTADKHQKKWFEIFKQNGADIILGDHGHAVQPVFIQEFNNKTVFELYCPGNFVNVYREYHGDSSAMIEVYIDKSNKKIIGGSVIPMYVESPENGNFRAIPTYDIVHNGGLLDHFSTDDTKRAQEAHQLITEVMLKSPMPLSLTQERFYFNENGFMRQPAPALELTDQMKQSALYSLIQSSHSICFIGDFITHGTKNGGFGWFEPLANTFKDKIFYNTSEGGATTKTIQNHIPPFADSYVIAIGTNDIRYRNSANCAMTETEYVDQIMQIKTSIRHINPNAKFVFIAPWTSTDGDPFCSLSFEEKLLMNKSYSNALERFCHNSDDLFIDPNSYLMEKINQKPVSYYLLDHIHPNYAHGISLYSEAVLISK